MNDYILLLVTIFFVLIAFYPIRKKRLIAAMLSMISIAFIAILYWYCGSFSEWHEYEQHLIQQNNARQLLDSEKGISEIIYKLQARLKTEPNDIKGWFLLGRVYISIADWELAYQSFKQAHVLAEKSSNTVMVNKDDLTMLEKIILNESHSFSMLNHQKLNKSLRDMLNNLLNTHPNQLDAMMLLAMDAYSNHHYKEAINLWQQTLKFLPSDSEDAAAIRQAIAKAFSSL